MKKDRRNKWNLPSAHDTILNGALIAISLVGLVLGLLTSGGVA